MQRRIANGVRDGFLSLFGIVPKSSDRKEWIQSEMLQFHARRSLDISRAQCKKGGRIGIEPFKKVRDTRQNARTACCLKAFVEIVKIDFDEPFEMSIKITIHARHSKTLAQNHAIRPPMRKHLPPRPGLTVKFLKSAIERFACNAREARQCPVNVEDEQMRNHFFSVYFKRCN